MYVSFMGKREGLEREREIDFLESLREGSVREEAESSKKRSHFLLLFHGTKKKKKMVCTRVIRLMSDEILQISVNR
jgi:hypothetical protein